MLPGKKFSPEDSSRILRKRVWWLLVPFAVVGASAAIARAVCCPTCTARTRSSWLCHSAYRKATCDRRSRRGSRIGSSPFRSRS